VLDEIVDVVIRHEEVRVGYVSIEKAKYFAKLHIQQTAFSLLVEKIEERLKGSLNSYCLLIADEQDEIEQRLIDDLDYFKQHGTEFGYNRVSVDRIIDSVHFVQSHNNYLMQLTDVICYLIRRGKEARQKLMKDYLEYRELGSAEYREWRDQHGHRGYRYFDQTYSRLNSAKPWVFSKDFP
jgi:hypothetical protein